MANRVQPVGPEASKEHAKPHAWWKVMCLTGKARTAKGRSPCWRSCCRFGVARRLCWFFWGSWATSCIITITLSSADAAVHLLENPYAPHGLHGHAVAVTGVLSAQIRVVAGDG